MFCMLPEKNILQAICRVTVGFMLWVVLTINVKSNLPILLVFLQSKPNRLDTQNKHNDTGNDVKLPIFSRCNIHEMRNFGTPFIRCCESKNEILISQ